MKSLPSTRHLNTQNINYGTFAHRVKHRLLPWCYLVSCIKCLFKLDWNPMVVDRQEHRVNENEQNNKAFKPLAADYLQNVVRKRKDLV